MFSKYEKSSLEMQDDLKPILPTLAALRKKSACFKNSNPNSREYKKMLVLDNLLEKLDAAILRFDKRDKKVLLPINDNPVLTCLLLVDFLLIVWRMGYLDFHRLSIQRSVSSTLFSGAQRLQSTFLCRKIISNLFNGFLDEVDSSAFPESMKLLAHFTQTVAMVFQTVFLKITTICPIFPFEQVRFKWINAGEASANSPECASKSLDCEHEVGLQMQGSSLIYLMTFFEECQFIPDFKKKQVFKLDNFFHKSELESLIHQKKIDALSILVIYKAILYSFIYPEHCIEEEIGKEMAWQQSVPQL